MATAILEKFGLAPYFDRICGATMDNSRDSKDKVIGYLLAQTNAVDAIMVGDTAFDVLGAAAHGIPTIGVTWGYGTAEDLTHSGAKHLVCQSVDNQDGNRIPTEKCSEPHRQR